MNAETVPHKETTVIRIDSSSYNEEQLLDPARAIRDGGLVGFPTETVYGIAVREDDPEAIDRLVNVRNSPRDKKRSVHIADEEDFRRFCPTPPPFAARLADRFWPGPLTLVLPHAERGTIGLRMPDHRIALDLIRLSEVDVVAPSANPSGDEPALTAGDVLDYFENQLDYVVDGGRVQHQISSTVVEIGNDSWSILREGAIPEEQIREERGTQILFVCSGNTCRSPMAVAIARSLFEERFDTAYESLREEGLRLRSAGTGATGGSPAAVNARNVIREDYGRSVREHTAQSVTSALLRQSDHIRVMTPRHREQLLNMAPELEERIRVLDEGDGGVPDPVGGNRSTYRKCARRIENALRTQLDDLIT